MNEQNNDNQNEQLNDLTITDEQAEATKAGGGGQGETLTINGGSTAEVKKGDRIRIGGLGILQ